jgi:hypothetical protein
MEENQKKEKGFYKRKNYKKSSRGRKKVTTIEALGFSDNLLLKLKKVNIANLADLLNSTEKDLSTGNILNRKDIGVIKKALNDNGLKLNFGIDSKRVKGGAKSKKSKGTKQVKAEDLVESDRYLAFEKDGKWGFKDKQGKVEIEPIYDEVFSFKEDLCVILEGDMYGYINRAGEIVIAPEYDMALSFSEGCACVYKGERCGYINVKNEILVPLKYEAGTYVIDGNCRVKKEGRWGELLINNPEEIRWII